ncbi:hypothetical protein D777_02834 [Marinobacter nitratireducens]|uniref:Uncharacterized protein n=1 Tax=Marinobacter nitratireducens TaxID=1137280 RepID=A0A072N0Y4_9GAMM|nr:hypothetical protein D777_02834 [Marinobacter nitratireducens]
MRAFREIFPVISIFGCGVVVQELHGQVLSGHSIDRRLDWLG